MDDPSGRLAALRRSYLFEGMTAEALEPLARAAAVRRVRRNEPLWQIGDPADDIYVVVDGEVKDAVVNLDGDEVVHFIHGPGMTVGEPGYMAMERDRIVQVVATQPATLLRLDRRDLDPFLVAHPEVVQRIAQRLASNTRYQTNLISTLLTRPLVDRVVLRLLELADTNAAATDGLRTPEISQSLLAAMVGVSRENVNRALGALVATGAIRRIGGRYEILDEGALRRMVARDWHPARLRDKRTRADGAEV